MLHKTSEPAHADKFAFEFSQALLDPACTKPASILGPNGKAAEKRFNVYRNNVAYSLVEALGKNYPAVKAQCADARFNDAALLYFADHPPRTKVMLELGDNFPDWLVGFAPAKAQMPHLADLAELERAWRPAYHAADVKPVAPEVLAAINPDHLGDVRFIRHPAAGLIQSQFAIFDLLNDGRSGIASNVWQSPQDVLITRPQFDVEVRLLPPGAAGFFSQLLNGSNLAAALEAGLAESPEFNIASALSLLVQSGVVSTVC